MPGCPNPPNRRFQVGRSYFGTKCWLSRLCRAEQSRDLPRRAPANGDGGAEGGPSMQLSIWRKRSCRRVRGSGRRAGDVAACANNPRPERSWPEQERRGASRFAARLRRECRRPRLLLDRQRRPLAGSPADARESGALAEASTPSTRSPSKATPTSAERANTTSRSVPSVLRPSANFLARNGINAARIRTVSYGKERPVAVCNDISCWSQNRRAQTVLNGRQKPVLGLPHG